MLKELTVRNFAIIEDITINFKEGMTVLTGQTGAGKSLLIDSISLLLGSRADTDMIRYGETEAYVKAVFDYNNSKIDDLLLNYDIESKEDITIERTVSQKKSYIKVNNKTINLQMLNSITVNLADLHSQTDSYRLFNKDNYLSFIDNSLDSKLSDLLNDYLIKREKYLSQYKKLNDILKKSNESKDNLAYLEQAYKEISMLDLSYGLDKEIENKINKMKNYDKIYSNLKDAYNKLSNEYFNLDSIYDAYDNIRKIEQYDKKLEDISSNLDSAYSLASEALESIKENLSNLDFDPNELDLLNEKLNEIENLELKYHKDFNGLLEYQENLKLEIDLSNNYDQVIKDNEELLKKNFNVLLDSANRLSDYRKTLAKNISESIEKECKDLELPHTSFEIKFFDVDTKDYHNKDIFLENGIDQIDFMISLNLGEPLKSLSKVASGGEMSRIMLAFKSYFAKRSNLSLMVFDEIDTGVSGSVAKEIARKMKNITKYNQVLAITHLPQVAAYADNQLYIYKKEINNRTITMVKELNFDERVEVIAKMISGEVVSSYALEASKQMIEENK